MLNLLFDVLVSGKDFAEFGDQESHSFHVPFESQCSHFTTSSSELVNLVNDFIIERNAGYCRQNPPACKGQ